MLRAWTKKNCLIQKLQNYWNAISVDYFPILFKNLFCIPLIYFYSWAINAVEFESHYSFYTKVEILFVHDHLHAIQKKFWNDKNTVWLLKSKFLPSSLVAHNGPTHFPLTQRILHKRRSPIGPTSPGNLLKLILQVCLCSVNIVCS